MNRNDQLEAQARAEKDLIEAVWVLVEVYGYDAEDIENALVETLTEVREGREE